MITVADRLFAVERTLHELLTLITEHIQISRACHDQVLLNAVIDARAMLKMLHD